MRSQNPIILSMALGSSLLLVGQAAEGRRGDPPPSTMVAVQPLAQVPVLELDAIDPAALLAEDLAKADGIRKPLRFALPQGVDVTPASHGAWERLDDGTRLWRLRLHAAKATDLYLGFAAYRLPVAATLHVIGEEGYYRGPYSERDNRPHGQLWTPVVPGEWATIELLLPADPAFSPELHLVEVGRGYRDLFQRSARAKGDQGSCNIDVVCPEGDDWRDEIRSVARYTVDGGLCTGSLVMNVERDLRDLFLTAAHCEIDESNAARIVFYWNDESPECGMLSGGSLDQAQSGAVFLARNDNVDFTLVELSDSPDPEFDVYYSGWDATGSTPQSSVCIHHPRGYEKAISFNDDPLTSGTTCINHGQPIPNSHWYVDSWEQGTTERGSSGSGLWDPATHLLVGFLSGGAAACGNQDYDCFGKLSAAWGGASADTRLRDWLDPNSTGTLTVSGANPWATIRYVAHQGNDVCLTGAGGGNGLWEPGEQILLDIELEYRGDYSNVTGTLTCTTPGVEIVGSTLSWPDATEGSHVTLTTPVAVQLPRSLECGSEPVRFDLQVSAAEGGPYSFTFSHEVGLSLVGQPATGTWILTVEDRTAGDRGTVLDWGIISQPQVTAQCSVCAVSQLRPRRVGRRVSTP